MFILIITLALGSNITTASVAGFESKKACLDAGNVWLKKNYKPLSDEFHGYSYVNALCLSAK